VGNNLIKDCPVTVKDMGTAIKVWGPSIAMLKGKTVRTTPPVIRQNVIKIPKEIWKLHKDVTLAIDIFFVNKIPFFITYSLVICFLLVTHLSNRKALTIFDALKSMCSFYLQRGFQIVFIKGDGELALLEVWMATVYGAPKLNLASANEHVPEIERKIQVIKKWVRAVIYSIPFNSLPARMLVHAVLFVTKQLNLFPMKGGLSSKLSPNQIMSGKVIHYKFCAMSFGWYCQIHEEDQPRNDMVQRTQGAISLGPSGNAQGGHKFFTLTTGKVVTCRIWTELPTSVAVIERVALLTKGMPALPIFIDCAGRVIGDVEDVYLHNIEDEADDALVDKSILPGVHTAEADDEIPGGDMVQEQDVDVDLDFAPANGGNVEPPLVDIPPPVNDAPVVSKVPTDGGARRSTRICMQPKPQYVPAFSGKMYSFATTVLGTKMLDNGAYGYN
jgi:hypothetical protein